MKRNHLWTTYSLLFAILSFSTPVLAFRFSPLVIHFTPSGPNVAQTVTLESQEAEKIPIQFEAFTRGIDQDGKEVREKTSDFTIYPEQLVLLPGEKRNVRITWAGKISDQNEKAFRIVATQIPVEFQDSNARAKKASVNLNFLLQYIASAYVTPPSAQSKIQVESVRNLEGKKIELTLANTGGAHRVLHPTKLILRSGDRDILELNSVKEINSMNVLAGTKMKVVVELPRVITEKNLSAELILSEIID
jgi:fimbrial chaperone protein